MTEDPVTESPTAESPAAESPTAAPRHWTTIAPQDAVNLVLPAEDVVGPINEFGEPCPWPWEPQQLLGVPLGQYHCLYCGSMVVAGLEHPDYRDDPDGMMPDGPLP